MTDTLMIDIALQGQILALLVGYVVGSLINIRWIERLKDKVDSLQNDINLIDHDLMLMTAEDVDTEI